jgi:hypothetical protein
MQEPDGPLCFRISDTSSTLYPRISTRFSPLDSGGAMAFTFVPSYSPGTIQVSLDFYISVVPADLKQSTLASSLSLLSLLSLLPCFFCCFYCPRCRASKVAKRQTWPRAVSQVVIPWPQAHSRDDGHPDPRTRPVAVGGPRTLCVPCRLFVSPSL